MQHDRKSAAISMRRFCLAFLALMLCQTAAAFAQNELAAIENNIPGYSDAIDAAVAGQNTAALTETVSQIRADIAILLEQAILAVSTDNTALAGQTLTLADRLQTLLKKAQMAALQNGDGDLNRSLVEGMRDIGRIAQQGALAAAQAGDPELASNAADLAGKNSDATADVFGYAEQGGGAPLGKQAIELLGENASVLASLGPLTRASRNLALCSRIVAAIQTAGQQRDRIDATLKSSRNPAFVEDITAGGDPTGLLGPVTQTLDTTERGLLWCRPKIPSTLPQPKNQPRDRYDPLKKPNPIDDDDGEPASPI